MTRITSAIAAAMIASASFATVALADGNYYEGAQPAASSIDRSTTGSIDTVRADQDGRLPFNNGGSRDDRASRVNSGDYYNGANRPN